MWPQIYLMQNWENLPKMGCTISIPTPKTPAISLKIIYDLLHWGLKSLVDLCRWMILSFGLRLFSHLTQNLFLIWIARVLSTRFYLILPNNWTFWSWLFTYSEWRSQNLKQVTFFDIVLQNSKGISLIQNRSLCFYKTVIPNFTEVGIALSVQINGILPPFPMGF